LATEALSARSYTKGDIRLNDACRNIRTVITLYLPGQPEKYDNVREVTLGDRRIQFITEDGRSVATNLPFLLERAPAK